MAIRPLTKGLQKACGLFFLSSQAAAELQTCEHPVGSGHQLYLCSLLFCAGDGTL